MQPLGTPPPPAAPTVADLEAGANQTNLRISWQAVLPEGPGPTIYTVSYTNGVTAGAVPGCQRLASLTCTHTGVPYDGLTYTYTVVASNQPGDEPGNRSLPSAGTSIEAVGRPAAWGAFEAVGTGTSQEAEVRYTVPDSRGDVSRVDILVAGSVVRTFPQQTGTNVQRIPTPGNEQPYPVQLRVCNEDAPVGCTLSGQQNVQSYGRLDGALGSIQPIVNGRSIQWVISGTSNGDAARVTYQVRNKGTNTSPGFQTYRPSGPGAFTFTTPAFSTEEYSKEQEIFVTIDDDSPEGRGQDTGSDSVSAGQAPPPSISIGRGAACNDTPDSGVGACAGVVEPACTDASCAYATLTIAFTSDAPQGGWSCSFDKFFPQRGESGSGNFSGGIDPYYQSGETVAGSCRFENYAAIGFETTFP